MWMNSCGLPMSLLLQACVEAAPSDALTTEHSQSPHGWDAKPERDQDPTIPYKGTRTTSDLRLSHGARFFIVTESWPTKTGGFVCNNGHLENTHARTHMCTIFTQTHIVMTDQFFCFIHDFFLKQWWSKLSLLFGFGLVWFCYLFGLFWCGFFESVFLLMLSSTWLETSVLLASATRFTLIFLKLLHWISSSLRKPRVFKQSGYWRPVAEHVQITL